MTESYYPAHARVEAWRVVPPNVERETRRRADPVYLGGLSPVPSGASDFSGGHKAETAEVSVRLGHLNDPYRASVGSFRISPHRRTLGG